MSQKLDTVEPGCRKFLEILAASGGPPIYTLSPTDARKVLEGAAQADPLGGPVPKQPTDIEDRTLLVGPKGEVRIRIVRPKGNKSRLPVLIYCHGGGWVLGSKDTHDRLIRDLANGAQAAVVFVDYDRSPEVKYPIAIEESYAVTKYVTENPKRFNVDASRIAVAGDSVGGNMTSAVTILAKQRGGPKIIQQIMFYPVTDANFHNGSYDQFAEGYFLTREAMKWFWNAYLPDETARKQPTASPLQASIEQLKGLPPALITSNENDVLRDEAEDYAHKLAQAGVPVTAVRFLGMTHDNLILGAITQTPGARAATALAIIHLQKAFNR
jgi:acetyl esterase